jgi:hypothetical protein
LERKGLLQRLSRGSTNLHRLLHVFDEARQSLFNIRRISLCQKFTDDFRASSSALQRFEHRRRNFFYSEIAALGTR